MAGAAGDMCGGGGRPELLTSGEAGGGGRLLIPCCAPQTSPWAIVMPSMAATEMTVKTSVPFSCRDDVMRRVYG